MTDKRSVLWKKAKPTFVVQHLVFCSLDSLPNTAGSSLVKQGKGKLSFTTRTAIVLARSMRPWILKPDIVMSVEPLS